MYIYEILNEFTNIILIIFGILLLIAINTIGLWKLFEKENKHGWASLIPFYNIYLLCKITETKQFWIIIAILSPLLILQPLGRTIILLSIIITSILINTSIAHKNNKNLSFTIGLILLPPIFYIKLGAEKNINENVKKQTPTIIIVLISIMSVLLVPLILISLIARIEWNTLKINKKFGEMEDGFYKRALKGEFNIKDDDYIKKITYSTGFDDGKIWEICVHYKFKIECKKTKDDSPYDEYYKKN